MFGIQVPAPDEALLISGRKSSEESPFKVIIGEKAFVPPIIRNWRKLTLSLQEAQVDEKCVTQQGITLGVKAVIAFKVANDEESIINAAQRFLSDQNQMSVLTGRIFAGHLRSIVGSMTVEEIITERQKLAEQVLDASKLEMGDLGLVVDSLQIQSIDDLGAGYINAMAAPHNAAIQRQAKIAQAQADQAAAEAQQASARAQAQYERDTHTAQAQYSASVATAQAEANQATQMAQAKVQKEVSVANAQAAQAGPLAEAQARREVLTAQTELAERNAQLREKELQAEVVKPAQAEAEQVQIRARADAEATKLQAEAAASSDRIALDRMLIEQLPALAAAVSASLQNANLNILNGTEGLSEVFSGVVGQGFQILDALKASVAHISSNGAVETGVTTHEHLS